MVIQELILCTLTQVDVPSNNVYVLFTCILHVHPHRCSHVVVKPTQRWRRPGARAPSLRSYCPQCTPDHPNITLQMQIQTHCKCKYKCKYKSKYSTPTHNTTLASCSKPNDPVPEQHWARKYCTYKFTNIPQICTNSQILYIFTLLRTDITNQLHSTITVQ